LDRVVLSDLEHEGELIMADPDETLRKHAERRREFLLKSAQTAAVAPAVALLLQAGSKPAHAAGYATTTVFTGPP
jgi:hypothetical protein